MEGRFGDSYSSLKPEQKMVGSEFMQNFETNKRNFGMDVPLVDMFLPMDVADTVSEEHYHRRDSQVKLTV